MTARPETGMFRSCPNCARTVPVSGALRFWGLAMVDDAMTWDQIMALRKAAEQYAIKPFEGAYILGENGQSIDGRDIARTENHRVVDVDGRAITVCDVVMKPAFIVE